MRSAPSVSFPVGRSRFEGGLLLALGLAGGAALALWMAQAVAPAGWKAGALAGWLAGCAWAWRQWRATPVGRLDWREEGWFWARAGEGAASEPSPLPAPPRVVLDLQHVLLLQAPGFAPRWFWLARRDDPACWNALRRAAHARAFGREATPAPASAAGGQP
ncbi:hypothetical protein [Xenophilus sp. Marseille-Q4582]|uniref:hypothetical protein n=1 Tax=Xenophilus sp. Marseille-Q4582 TaxID=2866600 RepID=UPI001CE468AD|nr:hypothetical protein [Xenophilus sp. Marseille-Q4582]